MPVQYESRYLQLDITSMKLGIFWRAAALAAWFTTLTLGAIPFARADSLEQPKDKPILTVSGKIAITNGSGTAQFDRAMLEGLGMVSFETTTPWYKGPVKFEGVPLVKLMAAVGATGQRIIAIALNDYSAEVPMEDAIKYNVILALKRDGEYMPVRDKGPLFVVYPFDSDPELKSQKFYSRSVWQVARMEVK
jgi:hypothetical protein